MATYDETKIIIIPVPSVSGSFDPITPTKSIILPVPSVNGVLIVILNNSVEGAILKDASPLTYTNYTIPANEDTANDVNLLPATPAVNDAFYFGVSNVGQYGFIRYLINIGTAGVGTWTITYYYYNGAWVALPAGNIILKSDQFLNFRTAGLGSLWIIPPTDWVTVAVNGITAYWIEARVTSYSAKTTIPLGNQVWQSPFGNAVKMMAGGNWKVVRNGWQMENGAWKPIADINQMVSTVWKNVPIG